MLLLIMKRFYKLFIWNSNPNFISSRWHFNYPKPIKRRHHFNSIDNLFQIEFPFLWGPLFDVSFQFIGFSVWHSAKIISHFWCCRLLFIFCSLLRLSKQKKIGSEMNKLHFNNIFMFAYEFLIYFWISLSLLL